LVGVQEGYVSEVCDYDHGKVNIQLNPQGGLFSKEQFNLLLDGRWWWPNYKIVQKTRKQVNFEGIQHNIALD
jgi:hypothetical protein